MGYETKKSQLYSQIFIYILAIVLISFILVYGYNAIHNFIERGEQIECLKFKNDLSNAIENILGDYGSVQIKEFSLCKGYSKICFVESFGSFDKNNPKFRYLNDDNTPSTDDTLIIDSISSGSGRNVFLIDNTAKDSYNIGRISVDDDVLCIKAVNNNINLRLEGKGNHVLLSEGVWFHLYPTACGDWA